MTTLNPGNDAAGSPLPNHPLLQQFGTLAPDQGQLTSTTSDQDPRKAEQTDPAGVSQMRRPGNLDQLPVGSKVNQRLAAAPAVIVIGGVAITAYEATLIVGIVMLATWQYALRPNDREAIMEAAKQQIIAQIDQGKEIVSNAWGMIQSSMVELGKLGLNAWEFAQKAPAFLNNLLFNRADIPAPRVNLPTAPLTSGAGSIPTAPLQSVKAPHGSVPPITGNPTIAQPLPVDPAVSKADISSANALETARAENQTLSAPATGLMAQAQQLKQRLDANLNKWFELAAGGTAALTSGTLAKHLKNQIETDILALRKLYSEANIPLSRLKAAHEALQGALTGAGAYGVATERLLASGDVFGWILNADSWRRDLSYTINRAADWVKEAWSYISATSKGESVFLPFAPIGSSAGVEAARNRADGVLNDPNRISQALPTPAMPLPATQGPFGPSVPEGWTPLPGTPDIIVPSHAVPKTPQDPKGPEDPKTPKGPGKLWALLLALGSSVFTAVGVKLADIVGQKTDIESINSLDQANTNPVVEFADIHQRALALIRKNLDENSSEAKVKEIQQQVRQLYLDRAIQVLQGHPYVRFAPAPTSEPMFKPGEISEMQRHIKAFQDDFKLKPAGYQGSPENLLPISSFSGDLLGDLDKNNKSDTWNNTWRKALAGVSEVWAGYLLELSGSPEVRGFDFQKLNVPDIAARVNAAWRQHGGDAGNKALDQARKDIWNHYLSRALTPLTSRLLPDEISSYKKQLASWLDTSRKPGTFVPLAPNGNIPGDVTLKREFQALVEAASARAINDIQGLDDRLAQLNLASRTSGQPTGASPSTSGVNPAGSSVTDTVRQFEQPPNKVNTAQPITGGQPSQSYLQALANVQQQFTGAFKDRGVSQSLPPALARAQRIDAFTQQITREMFLLPLNLQDPNRDSPWEQLNESALFSLTIANALKKLIVPDSQGTPAMYTRPSMEYDQIFQLHEKLAAIYSSLIAERDLKPKPSVTQGAALPIQ
jgi:hypothetical protein